MKVAIISNYAPPEKSAAVTRTVSLADYLEENNVEVSIYTPKRESLHGGEPDKRVNKYRSVFDLVRQMRKNKFDLIIATTPPGNITFHAVLAGKTSRLPVIVDIRDPWTQEEAKLGLVPKNTFAYFRNRLMEWVSYTGADKLFVVSKFLKEEIIKSFRISNDKFTVVSNGADTKLFYKNAKEGAEVREKLGIPADAPLLVYEGILGGKELDKFLSICGKELAERYNAHLLFVAIIDKFSQSIAEELKKIAAEKGFRENLHLNGPVELKEMRKYLSAGDIALNPLPSERLYCIPVKTYEYLACGLPVACKAPRNGGLWKFMEKNKFGFCAESWEEFRKLILHSFEHLNELKQKADAAPELIKREYSRRKANETALNEITKLIKK